MRRLIILLLPLIVSGCNVTNHMRDEYMGKRYLQPGKVADVPLGEDRARSESMARPASPGGAPGHAPVSSNPVARDQYGNPILE